MPTGAVGVEFSHAVHREKFALASSLGSPTPPRAGTRAAGDPVLSARPQRRRAPRLGDHDARGRHGDPARRQAAATARQDLDPHGSDDDRLRPEVSWRGSRSRASSAWSRTAQGLYTSDLSVNEFLLITQAGFDPVGLVVGSSIFHIGIQIAGPTASQELTCSPRRCTARAIWR